MVRGRSSKLVSEGLVIEDDRALDLGKAAKKHAKEIQLLKDNLVANGFEPLERFAPHDYYRFIRARKGDLKAAQAMLENHILWRKEIDVEHFREHPNQKEIDEAYPCGFAGICKEGRPIVVEKTGLLDLPKIAKYGINYKGDLSVIDYYSLNMEKTRHKRFLAHSLSSGHPCYVWTSIIDLRGGTFARCAHKMVRDFIKELAARSSAHYPESLGKLYVVGAPFGFETIWKCIKLFLDPNTARKIEIHKDLAVVYENVDKTQLPESLGGTMPETVCYNPNSEELPWNNAQFLHRLETEGYQALWEEVYRKQEEDEAKKQARKQEERNQDGTKDATISQGGGLKSPKSPLSKTSPIRKFMQGKSKDPGNPIDSAGNSAANSAGNSAGSTPTKLTPRLSFKGDKNPVKRLSKKGKNALRASKDFLAKKKRRRNKNRNANTDGAACGTDTAADINRGTNVATHSGNREDDTHGVSVEDNGAASAEDNGAASGEDNGAASGEDNGSDDNSTDDDHEQPEAAMNDDIVVTGKLIVVENADAAVKNNNHLAKKNDDVPPTMSGPLSVASIGIKHPYNITDQNGGRSLGHDEVVLEVGMADNTLLKCDTNQSNGQKDMITVSAVEADGIEAEKLYSKHLFIATESTKASATIAKVILEDEEPKPKTFGWLFCGCRPK